MVNPTPKVHGRGAQSGVVPQRFGLSARQSDGDWLDERDGIDGPAPRLRTTVIEEKPRTIVSFNQSPDIPFDRSINAYRGCDHPSNRCVGFSRWQRVKWEERMCCPVETRLGFCKLD
ncbi:MAG: radical SAM protein [Sphingomonadales bacterium]|nr:radical SAM protein [Sphingomonadales bacterium]